MLEAMGAGPLPVDVVHLLWSGGPKMDKKAKFTLADARRVQALCPIVSALGYSCGNHMEEGKVEVRDLLLACREREWMIPPWARERITIRDLEDGDYYRAERMTTRHNALGSPSASKFLLPEALEQQEKALEEKALAKSAKKAKGDSTQMIASTQCIAAGSWFWGEMILRDLAEMERWAVGSALYYASIDGDAADGSITMRVGGKRNSGCGRVKVWFEASESLVAPVARDWKLSTETGVGRLAPGIAQLREHYRARSAEILSALGGIYGS
jgi:hypothetical protein